MTAIANYWAGMEFDLYCSDEDFKALGKENAYCVINHKYDIDWLICWVFSQRVNMLGVSFRLIYELFQKKLNQNDTI
jgi:lysophosphatidic acid acyltransferase/lysophosphatidylinositol acyltransferase